MIIKRKYLFLTIYFLMMLGLFFSISDLCPMQGIFNKVKYIFILFAFIEMLTHYFPYHHLNKSVIFVFAIYICFCFLYGKVWVTNTVAAETSYQFRTTLLMLLIIFLVYYEVEYYRCFELFMHVSFAAIVIFLLFSYICNLDQSSFNPIYIFKYLFNGDARGRARFGLGHWNYVGFYVYTELIVSIFCFKHASIAGRYRSIYRCSIVIVDYIMYLMIVSASSRAAILSFCLFCGILLLHAFIMRIIPGNRLAIRVGLLITAIIIVIVGVKSGFFTNVWNNSSRSLNISKNMPIFKEHGNFYTGMGWVETGALQDTVDAFGLGTSSLDMFYVYVYFTTGLIGCIFMIIVYGTIGICNFINIKRRDGFYYIALYLSLLFYLYWDTILFTIKFWPGIFIVVALLHGMGNKEKNLTYHLMER